jgi:hypothetical protein
MAGRNLVKVETDKCIIELNNLDKNGIDKVKNNILENIKIDNLHSILHDINKNSIYQIAYWPDGGNLTKNADGTITAVFRDESGRILQHGRLKNAGPDFVNLSKTVANQIMLMHIIAQLNEINVKLDNIIKGQHDDRISEIEGAIKTYNYLSDDDKSDLKIMNNIILQLTTGITKNERELKNELNDIDPNVKFSDNWASSKNKIIEKKHFHITETIFWIIKGYETLIEWDINYNKKNMYNNSVEEFIQFLYNGKWEELIMFARALPYKKNEFISYPEEIWENINTKKPDMINVMKNQLKIKKNEIKEYVISARGSTLLEVFNEM